jgi:hypothetical protein
MSIDQFQNVIANISCLNASGQATEVSAEQIRLVTMEAIAPANSLGGLRSCIVPDDKVVVAGLSPIPHWQIVLPAIAHAIAEITGIPVTDLDPTSDGFCFLFAESIRQTMSQAELSALSVPVVFHDASADSDLALLATSCDDQAVHVNRRLFDADVIVLLSSPDGSSNSIRSGIYPAFGSGAGRKHFLKQSRENRQKDLRLVESSLGVSSAVSVLADPAGSIEGILAGERDEMLSQIATDVENNWSLPETSEHDLVVATVELPSAHSSWNEFLHAIHAVDRFGAAKAPIVMLTDISRPPPARIAKQFQQSFLDDHATDFLDEDRNIATILKRHPVYLASNLPQPLVELLGLGFIESESELQKLIERASNPVLIRNAHKCSLHNLQTKPLAQK